MPVSHNRHSSRLYTAQPKSSEIGLSALSLPRSEFFRGLLSTGLSEGGSSEFTVTDTDRGSRMTLYQVTDTDRDTLLLLLEFLYTSGVKETPENLGGQQVIYALIRYVGL